MLAIFSLDSYNRGYDLGIKLPAGSMLGSATIVSDSSIIKENGVRTDIPAGFYAIAYDWTHDGITEKVIAIRGTDKIAANPFGNGSGADFGAYGIGIGQPFALTGGLTAQARLTIE